MKSKLLLFAMVCTTIFFACETKNSETTEETQEVALTESEKTAEWDHLFNDYYQDFPSLTLASRGDDAAEVVNPNLKEACSLYDQKDYNNAIVLFDKVLENEPNTLEANFYKSLALISLNRPAEAVEGLTFIASTENHLTETAEWYLALANIKIGETDKAVDQLTKISQKENHKNKARAKDILDQAYNKNLFLRL